MCNDCSKLRLLADRKDYRGAKGDPNIDPRQGLDGEYGNPLSQFGRIRGWIQKWHPKASHRVESTVFDDMPEHWTEVCNTLDFPEIMDAQDHSTANRPRAWWANILFPDACKDGYDPVDPDTCMGPGRTSIKHSAENKWCVPQCASTHNIVGWGS